MYTAKGGEDCLFPFNLWGFGGFRGGEGGGGNLGPRKGLYIFMDKGPGENLG